MSLGRFTRKVWAVLDPVFHHSIVLVRGGSNLRAVPGGHGTVVPGVQSLAITHLHRPLEKPDPGREGEVSVLTLCGGLVDG